MATEYTQPTVFESVGGDDSAEVEVGQIPTSLSRPLSSLDNDDPVVMQRVDAAKAFQKFAQTEFDTRNKDFSDAVTARAKKTKYEVLARNSTRSSIAAVDESQLTETPMEKFNRLKAEITQFITEVSEAKAAGAAADGSDDVPDWSEMASQLQVLQNQLISAKGDIQQVFSSPSQEDLTGVGLAGLVGAKVGGGADGSISKHLAAQIQSMAPQKQHQPQQAANGAIYELYYKPDISKEEAAMTGKVAQLEKRLALLESVLAGADTNGSAAALMFENTKGLAGTLSEVQTRVQKLSEENLSNVSRRIDQLMARAEQVQQMRTQAATGASSLITSEHLRKLEMLHNALPKIDKMATELPLVVDRLVQLRAVHEQAAAINNSWSQLTTEQAELTASVTAAQQLLTKMEENMGSNMQTMLNNVKVLEEKMAALQSKRA